MTDALQLIQELEEFNTPTLSESAALLLEVAYFCEKGNALNEDFDFQAVLKKAGLKVTKSDGLLKILAKAGKNLSKMFWLALKASTGGSADKQNLKEFLKTHKIKKEQVVDVLLRLDTLTLHIITSPLRMLDALTGWNVVAAIETSIQPVKNHISKAMAELKNAVEKAKGEYRQRIQSMVKNLETLFVPLH